METLELLSKREKQVAEHITLGQSQQEIANNLYVCVRTIKFHCGNIYKKMKVKNRKELIHKITHQS